MSEIKYNKDFEEHYDKITGLHTFHLGSIDGKEVYADFFAEVRTDYSILPNHNKGKYYISPVYNMDGNKGYIAGDLNTERETTYISLPSDVIRRCEETAKNTAISVKCEDLRKEIYAGYKKNFDRGLFLGMTKGEKLLSYDKWLETDYKDEGWFAGSVPPEEARFLCENDPLVNVSYEKWYTKKPSKNNIERD